jgi:hypothetical protein
MPAEGARWAHTLVLGVLRLLIVPGMMLITTGRLPVLDFACRTMMVPGRRTLITLEAQLMIPDLKGSPHPDLSVS